MFWVSFFCFFTFFRSVWISIIFPRCDWFVKRIIQINKKKRFIGISSRDRRSLPPERYPGVLLLISAIKVTGYLSGGTVRLFDDIYISFIFLTLRSCFVSFFWILMIWTLKIMIYTKKEKKKWYTSSILVLAPHFFARAFVIKKH